MVLSTVSLRAERLLCIGGLGVRDSSWMYAYKTHAYGRFGHLWGKISESLEPVPRVQCLIFRHETFTGSLFHHSSIQRIWPEQNFESARHFSGTWTIMSNRFD